MKPQEPCDVVFLDSQKSTYRQWLAIILGRSRSGAKDRLLRAGGLIIADSTLRSGLVADDSNANPHSSALLNNLYEYARYTDLQELREFNALVNGTRRLGALVVPLFDGLTNHSETHRLG